MASFGDFTLIIINQPGTLTPKTEPLRRVAKMVCTTLAHRVSPRLAASLRTWLKVSCPFLKPSSASLCLGDYSQVDGVCWKNPSTLEGGEARSSLKIPGVSITIYSHTEKTLVKPKGVGHPLSRRFVNFNAVPEPEIIFTTKRDGSVETISGGCAAGHGFSGLVKLTSGVSQCGRVVFT
jgi:hypothetical protein